MGGRGRGRGSGGMSFSAETMGHLTSEGIPEVMLAPPPVYPPLEFRPAPLTVTPKLVQFRRQFFDAWSPLRTTLQVPIEKNYATYKQSQEEPKEALNFQWGFFPNEIRPSTRLLKRTKPKKANAVPVVSNIDDLLASLEKAEKLEIKKERDDDQEGKEKEKRNEENEGEEIEEEDDPDEEMDEGTDYNQNYFDNGEDYLDDDDDMDDGPIY